MALRKCKECGHPVSSQANSCPQCGAPVKERSSPLAIGYWLGLFILIVLVGMFIIPSLVAPPNPTDTGLREKSSTSSSTVDLTATVQFTGTQFVIHNRDSFDWTNVKLAVNPGTFSRGYTLTTPRLVAGETYTVGAMQLTKSDGERFNPLTHKPTNFSISCDTPRGNGFYYGSWK